MIYNSKTLSKVFIKLLLEKFLKLSESRNLSLAILNSSKSVLENKEIWFSSSDKELKLRKSIKHSDGIYCVILGAPK